MPSDRKKEKSGRRDNAIFGTTDRDWIQLSFHRRHFAQSNGWNMHFDDVRELMGLAAGTSKGCDMVLEILGDIEIELRRVQDFLRDERSRYLTSEQADAVTEHGCQCRTLVKKTGECPHEH